MTRQKGMPRCNDAGGTIRDRRVRLYAQRFHRRLCLWTGRPLPWSVRRELAALERINR